jgi:DNA invertase Pin-like site-specific DNA recombinase
MENTIEHSKNMNICVVEMEKGFKKNGIIYCRLSRVPDNSRGVLSLDSQEHAIKAFMKNWKIGIYGILKNIGSAFSKPQTDLKNYLKNCKNKVLIVYEANRLSRNLNNFKDIYNICKKNKHKIAIVNMNMIFDCNLRSNYEILFDLIFKAEKESRDMGARISRTYQYKKSRETLWGKMRDSMDNIVDNPKELMISSLIHLLGKKDSNVENISSLIFKLTPLENPEPFELVEYTKTNLEETNYKKLPYSMDDNNIALTLNIYSIKYRNRKCE